MCLLQAFQFWIMGNVNKPGDWEKKQHSIEFRQNHFRGEIFKSNYPPPEVLAKYAELNPSFPERLIAMAEKESGNRRKIERRLAGWSIFLDVLGTLLAPAVVTGVLQVGYIYMKNSYATEGAWIIATVTVAIAIAFLTRGKRMLKIK